MSKVNLKQIDEADDNVNTKLTDGQDIPVHKRKSQLQDRLNDSEETSEEKQYKKPGRPATGHERKGISFSLPIELIEAFNQYCKEKKYNKSAVVEDLIEKLLNGEE